MEWSGAEVISAGRNGNECYYRDQCRCRNRELHHGKPLSFVMQLFVRDLRRERCNLFIGTQSAERMIRAPTMAAIVLEKSIAETYCRVAVGCGSSRTASVIFYARPVRDRCCRFVARPNACTPSLGQLWGGSRSPRCSDDLSFSIRRSTKAPTPHPQLLRAAELDCKANKMSVPYTQKKTCLRSGDEPQPA